MVDDAELAAPRRSKRLMKCMPELPAADSGTGQVTRSSDATPNRSHATGNAFDANGVGGALLPAEVGGSAPHADEFDQTASEESNGESDLDDCLQVHDPPACEEDDFDVNGLRIDRQPRQIRPGAIPIYDVQPSAVKSWGLAIPG